jgi:FlaA1/EpsC-like NDP-sugar epimerase
MAQLKRFLPLALIVAGLAASLYSLTLFKDAPRYPYLVLSAPGNVDLVFLFSGRRDQASCERLATNVSNGVLAACPACRVREKKCLDALDERQRLLLSEKPLDVPSARLADGGVIAFLSRDARLALESCRESEKQATSQPASGRVVCHAPDTERSLPRSLPLFGRDGPGQGMGWIMLALGALALLFGLYLVNRLEELRAYLSALPRRVKRIVVLALDTALVPAALGTTVLVEYGTDWRDINGLTLMLVLAPLTAIPVFMAFGLYRAFIRYLDLRMLLTIVVSVTIATLLFVGILDLIRVESLKLEDIIVFWLVALLFVGGSRALAHAYLRPAAASDGASARVVIYGAGEAGAQLAASLRGRSELTPVAFVDDNPDLAGSLLYGVKVHPAAQLPALVRRLDVRQILLAIPSASKKQKRDIFDRIEHLGVRIRTIPRLSEIIEGRATIDDIEDVGVEDLFGRDPVPPVPSLLVRCIEGKTVLVTGAGGSIGSELCRQILSLAPKKLILVEMSEYALYAIHEELLARKRQFAFAAEIVAVLASVTHRGVLRGILAQHRVDTVYHAAAYKHVPLVEANPLEAIRNNVLGSLRAVEAAAAENIENFVLVSTDKAVRPANIMGATKRLAELLVQSMDGGARTRFCMVRFGNVLDSSGSVVPLFRRQIQEGGPVTVTHPDITRYFMTIPEAAQLVLQAGSMATGGDVFVLDMGNPVRIVDLARRMIRLSGHTVRDEENPSGEIEIRFTGLRPGEKLYEELLVDGNASRTEHPLIMRASESALPWPRLKPLLESIEEACNRLDEAKAVALLLSVVPLLARPEAAGGAPEPHPAPLKLVT